MRQRSRWRRVAWSGLLEVDACSHTVAPLAPLPLHDGAGSSISLHLATMSAEGLDVMTGGAHTSSNSGMPCWPGTSSHHSGRSSSSGVPGGASTSSRNTTPEALTSGCAASHSCAVVRRLPDASADSSEPLEDVVVRRQDDAPVARRDGAEGTLRAGVGGVGGGRSGASGSAMGAGCSPRCRSISSCHHSCRVELDHCWWMLKKDEVLPQTRHTGASSAAHTWGQRRKAKQRRSCQHQHPGCKCQEIEHRTQAVAACATLSNTCHHPRRNRRDVYAWHEQRLKLTSA